MEQQTEKPKRRPSIEVRCPKCGTPERAIHTETEFHSWPFFIAVYETSRMSSCTTSKRLLASFCEEADYLEWLKAEYDDGTVEWEER